MMEDEYKNRVDRRQQVEDILGERPKGGYRHEASKSEQQTVGEQVIKSVLKYNNANIRELLSKSRWSLLH